MRPSRNVLLLCVAAVLAVTPLLLYKPQPNQEAFAGADSQAKDMISHIAPHYRPWMNSPLKPPSGEVEGLLFALQAALGAGFIGYFFGVRRERARHEEKSPGHGDAVHAD